ncbi:MAG: hypothetical protein PHQ35_06695 [Phycisphaerae bacterium]|nr:hypothetical protein [Phycisphaerae bacterium]MDD5381135.1 hypothetical protein [Phycisphaerae bacterium]
MNTLISQLSAVEYKLLNDCVAWHIRPHRQVFLEGLAVISKSLRFDNLNVLELGATARSTLSLFLVARGAKSMVTCYSNGELSKLDKALSLLAQQYGLMRERLLVGQAGIFALDQKTRFDLVMLKDVLGGVNRQHSHAEFRKAVSNCLSILNPNGHLLIIDKAHSLKIIYLILRKLGSAGRNGWHYFTFNELKQMIPIRSFETFFAAHGVLSFGNFGDGILQKAADFLDEHCVEMFVSLEKRVVFSLVCVAKVRENAQKMVGNFLPPCAFD